MALIRKISILSFALLLFACGGGSGGNGGGGDASTIKLQFDDVVDQDGNPRDFIGAIHGFLGLHEHNLTNFGTKPITINKIILRTDSPVDQLINEMNSCENKTLQPKQSCSFYINYLTAGQAISKTEKSIKEDIIINYNDSQIFTYHGFNTISLPEITITNNCNDKKCIFQLNTESKLPSMDVTIKSMEFHESSIPITLNTCIGLKLDNKPQSCEINFQYNDRPDNIYTVFFNLIYKGVDREYEKQEHTYVDTKQHLNFNSNFKTVNTSCKTHTTTKQVHPRAIKFDPYVLTISKDFFAKKIHVKSVEYKPSATNYEWYDKKIINETPIIENCSSKDLEKCTIQIDGGCEGSGSAGIVKIIYTVDDNPLDHEYIYTLPEVSQPEINIQYAEIDEEAHTVWNSKNLVDTVTIPVKKANYGDPGFWVELINSNEAATYVVPDMKYQTKYARFLDPNGLCFGKSGVDLNDIYYIPGIFHGDSDENPYSTICTFGMDAIQDYFINNQANYILKVGNHGQYTINFIFKIID
jgi:hypothetical protein